MPTAEDLERVQGLVKRLLGIGAVAPGVVISADAWNVLVDSVVEVARSLVELGSGEVPPHEHRDQVGLAWLDARVRALVESGPIVEPSAQARLQDLEHARVRIDASVGTLGDTLGALRTETREVKTRDLAREQSVNVVRRKLEGVADARDDVESLRSSLEALSERVEEAVKLGRLLRGRGGQPIDVGGLAERVGGLEALRERLRFPSGEDFDAVLLDQRLSALRAEMVTEEELREAIADLGRRGEDNTRAIGDRLSARVDERLDERAKVLEEGLEALADARVGRVQERLPTLVADAVAPVEERASALAAKEAAAAAARAVEAAEARLDKRLTALGTTLRNETTAAVDGLRETVDARLAARLDAILPERLAGLTKRVGGVEERLGALDGGFASLRDQLGGLDARVDDLQRTAQADTAALRRQLSALDGGVDAATRSAGEARDSVRKLDETFDDRATGAAKTVVERELEGMREEVRRIVDDELAGIEDKVIERFEAEAAAVVERRVTAVLRREMRNVANEVYDERNGQ